MKRSVAFVITAVVLLAGIAVAQNSLVIKVNVPFEFHVGSKALPAGEYLISRLNSRDMLLITGIDNKSLMLVPSIPAGRTGGTVPKLTFYQYANTYFMRQVWIPGTQGNDLIPSSAEKEYMAKVAGGERIAVLGNADKSR